MIEWYWVVVIAVVFLLAGWALRAKEALKVIDDLEFRYLENEKALRQRAFEERLTPESVFSWLYKMEETERSKILYLLVKHIYNGRRTIHRCPTRKGKSINPLDPPEAGERKQNA